MSETTLRHIEHFTDTIGPRGSATPPRGRGPRLLPGHAGGPGLRSAPRDASTRPPPAGSRMRWRRGAAGGRGPVLDHGPGARRASRRAGRRRAGAGGERVVLPAGVAPRQPAAVVRAQRPQPERVGGGAAQRRRAPAGGAQRPRGHAPHSAGHAVAGAVAGVSNSHAAGGRGQPGAAGRVHLGHLHPGRAAAHHRAVCGHHPAAGPDLHPAARLHAVCERRQRQRQRRRGRADLCRAAEGRAAAKHSRVSGEYRL